LIHLQQVETDLELAFGGFALIVGGLLFDAVKERQERERFERLLRIIIE